MLDQMSSILAANLKRLREARGLTQQKLADVSGVPRPTLAHLESGAANPTLGVMLKVALALHASVEELIGEPAGNVTLHRARTLKTRVRGQARFRELVVEPLPGFAIERVELGAGAHASATPRAPGTRHYVACESGELQLSSGDEAFELSAGDVLVMRGAGDAVYANRGRRAAVAYSVVLPAPSGV